MQCLEKSIAAIVAKWRTGFFDASCSKNVCTISTKLRDKLRHNSHGVLSVLIFAGYSGSKQWDQFPNIFQIYLLDFVRKTLLSEDTIPRKYEF